MKIKKDCITYLCDQTKSKSKNNNFKKEGDFKMNKIVKRITALATAVMMVASISAVSAGAYSSTYLGETNKSTSTSRKYISCYNAGAFTYDNINGSAWTKTTTVASVLNPNCSFNGIISVITACGKIHGEQHYTFSSAASCSLAGKYTTTTVTSSHSFQSNEYGNFSKTLYS